MPTFFKELRGNICSDISRMKVREAGKIERNGIIGKGGEKQQAGTVEGQEGENKSGMG